MVNFTRFVEIGRVCNVNYGKDNGKVCTIVDIVDLNKALVDGPREVTGVSRQIINFKRLLLTDFKIDISKNASSTELAAALQAGNVLDKWNSSEYAVTQKIKRARASATDFERYKLRRARVKKSRAINEALESLKSK